MNAAASDRLYSRAMLNEVVKNETIIRRIMERTGTLTDIAGEFGLSRRTVARIRDRKKDGAELYDRRHDNPGRESGTADEAIAFTLQYMEHFPKAKLAAILREMENGSHGYAGPVPTYRQLRYTLGNLPADMLEMIRNGTKDYLLNTALTPRREESRVNAVWQIDALELPMHSIDVESGELITPWMVGAIDCCSRVVPLASACRSHPKTVDVLKGLLTAILPGGQTFAYGSPVILVPDNHAIFTSEEFLDGARRAGITVEFTPKEAPQAKGKIERFFRTFAEQFCAHLAGYSDQSSGLQKARQGAIPFPCLQPLIDKFLRKYHSSHHAGIGTAPWIRWTEGLEKAEGLLVNAQELRNAFKLRREATVHRDGICISEDGWHLHSSELEGLQGEKVILRVDLNGTSNGVEAYHRNIKVADLLVVEGNTDLATAINKGKIRRTTELREFRKMMRGRIEKIPKFQTPAQKPPRKKPTPKIEDDTTSDIDANGRRPAAPKTRAIPDFPVE